MFAASLGLIATTICGILAENTSITLQPNHKTACRLEDIGHGQNEQTIVCENSVQAFAMDNSTCVAQGGQLFMCLDGTWKTGTFTGIAHPRKKRFFRIILLAVMTYCYIKHGNTICKKGDPEKMVPPNYTNCPTRKRYTAEKGKKSVKVRWDVPTATDDKEVVSNVQTTNFENGQEFYGYPEPGRDYWIRYKATDSHGLTAVCDIGITVTYIACGPLYPPNYTRQGKCTLDHTYGSECSFVCEDGYELKGTTTAECQADGSWTAIPRCTKVSCGPPPQPAHGISLCAPGDSLLGDICFVKCDAGFSMTGFPITHCLTNKMWSTTELHCEDTESPRLMCKSPQVFYADHGYLTTNVNWEKPSATDNVDNNPTITKVSGPEHGDLLSAGTHIAVYKATDSSDNMSPECAVRLEVNVIRCSNPLDALENRRFMMYDCTDNTFYRGIECVLSCDLNLPLSGTDLMVCEGDETSGNGKWNWGSEPQPFCQVVDCPPVNIPDNGGYTTNSVNARPLHVMFCQKGYDISSVGETFVGRLTCQDDGQWYPLSSFPNCIVSVLPILLLPAELYIDGECNDEKTQQGIKEQILIYLSNVQADVDNSICPEADTCRTENIIVVCGDTTKRRRSIVQKRQTGFAIVTFDIVAVFDQGNMTTQDAYAFYTGKVNQISGLIQADVETGNLVIPNFSIGSDAFQVDSQIAFSCETGYKRDGLKCKPCPKGTYLNYTTGNCEYCKIGESADQNGLEACIECPEGYSTITTGSKNDSECLRKCEAGFASYTTMEPCTPCATGTFQNIVGQSTCTQCPLGMTTNGTKSTSEDFCQTFDLLFGQTTGRAKLVSFAASETSQVTLTFWAKLQSAFPANVSISLSTTDQHILDIKLNSEIEITSGSTSLTTSASLSDNHWTLVVLGLDLIASSISLSVDHEIILEEKNSFENLGEISSGALYADSTGVAAGVFISSLSLYFRTLTSSELATLASKCSLEPNDAVLSMTHFVGFTTPGIVPVLPSKCDAINGCKDEPCGHHRCIDDVDGFTCECLEDMTGDLCMEPPDRCIDNKCQNGTCIQGNDSYSCSCVNGFTGSLCDNPPVNGQWSEWTEWSPCGVTCGAGTVVRTRLCNNPIPGFMGKDCQGNKEEAKECDLGVCQECPKLKRNFGTIVTCVEDMAVQLTSCNVTCLPDRVVPPGIASFPNYTCGRSTGYDWLPVDKVPACVAVSKPSQFGTSATVTYDEVVHITDQQELSQNVQAKFSDMECVKSGACSMSTSVTAGSRRRRSAGSTVAVTFEIKMVDQSDLDLQDYLNTGSASPSLEEVLRSMKSIEQLNIYVANNTAYIFNVQVNGRHYNVDTRSLDVFSTFVCSEGYTGSDGMCAECPAGSKYSFPDCLDCEIGTYQPLTAQSTCLPCPEGFTTRLFGSTAVADCNVELPSDKNDITVVEVHQTTTIIAICIGTVVSVIAFAVMSYCLWKKVSRKQKRQAGTQGSAVSLNMIRPDRVQQECTAFASPTNLYPDKLKSTPPFPRYHESSVDVQVPPPYVEHA